MHFYLKIKISTPVLFASSYIREGDILLSYSVMWQVENDDNLTHTLRQQGQQAALSVGIAACDDQHATGDCFE